MVSWGILNILAEPGALITTPSTNLSHRRRTTFTEFPTKVDLRQVKTLFATIQRKVDLNQVWPLRFSYTTVIKACSLPCRWDRQAPLPRLEFLRSLVCVFTIAREITLSDQDYQWTSIGCIVGHSQPCSTMSPALHSTAGNIFAGGLERTSEIVLQEKPTNRSNPRI